MFFILILALFSYLYTHSDILLLGKDINGVLGGGKCPEIGMMGAKIAPWKQRIINGQMLYTNIVMILTLWEFCLFLNKGFD